MVRLYRWRNFQNCSKFRLFCGPGTVQGWPAFRWFESKKPFHELSQLFGVIFSQTWQSGLNTFFFLFIPSVDYRVMVNFLINLRIFKSHYAMGKITRKRKNFPWLKKINFEEKLKVCWKIKEIFTKKKLHNFKNWDLLMFDLLWFIYVLMRELFSIIFLATWCRFLINSISKWSCTVWEDDTFEIKILHHLDKMSSIIWYKLYRFISNHVDRFRYVGDLLAKMGSRTQFLFSEMISRISVTLARRQLSTTGQRRGGFSYFITRSPKVGKRAMWG